MIVALAPIQVGFSQPHESGITMPLRCVGDVGVFVLPESPCAVVAVPIVLILHWSHPHPTKEQPTGGGGSSFSYFTTGTGQKRIWHFSIGVTAPISEVFII